METTKKITLINDFHDTEIKLVVDNCRLSLNQTNKAKRALCGIKDCKCSGPFGYRGYQNDFDGVEEIIDQEGKCLGGIVYFR